MMTGGGIGMLMMMAIVCITTRPSCARLNRSIYRNDILFATSHDRVDAAAAADAIGAFPYRIIKSHSLKTK
jgi:hypothetical protein